MATEAKHRSQQEGNLLISSQTWPVLSRKPGAVSLCHYTTLSLHREQSLPRTCPPHLILCPPKGVVVDLSASACSTQTRRKM